MTSEEVYILFIEQVNKNGTNDNLAVDRGRFVSVFNRAELKYVEWILEKRNEDDIRYIQRLLVADKQLTSKRTLLNHQDFALPSDFLSFSNIQVFASSGGCSNEKMQVFEAKHEDIEELLADKFNKPSFKYRETFYTIGGDEVKVYVDNFSINKVYMTYYRKPKGLDIEGYIKVDNSASLSKDPEWDNNTINRILDIAVKEFNLDSDNLQRYQIDERQILQKI